MNLDAYLNLALDAAEEASKAILKEKEKVNVSAFLPWMHY